MSYSKPILIIEDSDIKAEGICNVLKTHCPEVKVTRKKSYTEGLCAIDGFTYGLIVLDMTLPVYDVNESDSGYEHLGLAGDVILGEIQRLKVKTRVIVITQYRTFVDLERSFTREELDRKLARDYPEVYMGCIYYRSESTAWGNEFSKLLREVCDT